MRDLKHSASALHRLGENRARIRTLLAEIAVAESTGFGLDPESVNWGHAGDTSLLIHFLEEAKRVACPIEPITYGGISAPLVF